MYRETNKCKELSIPNMDMFTNELPGRMNPPVCDEMLNYKDTEGTGPNDGEFRVSSHE